MATFGQARFLRLARTMVRALAFLATFHALAGVAASFTAAYQQNPIYMGQSATLELRFDGAAPRQPPEVTPVAGLTVGGTGSSQQINIINGVARQSIVFTFLLTPSKPGDYQLPPVKAEVDGQTLLAQAPVLKVLPASADPREQQIRQLAFLRLAQPKKEVYIGEPFAVQIELIVQNARDPEFPRLQSDGFTFGNMLQPTQDRIPYNGMIYNRLTFQASAVAVKAGHLVIGPAECVITLLLPPARQDPFDFFGQRYEARRTTLTSDLHPVKVLPLPQENVPPDFSGAVGSFSRFEVEAGPTNLAVGDPITLKIRIAGRGRLDAVTLDAPAQWREFKSYPSTATVQTADPLGLEGVKTIEQVVVPENAEVTELPALSFSFFDPEKRAYRTLKQPAIPLTVRPGAVASAPTIVAATNQSNAPLNAPRDIIHIKPRPGTLTATVTPLVLRPGFWLANLVPVVAWLGVLVWRKRADKLANDPRLRRRRKVDQLVREGIAELHRLAAAGESEAFFATTFHLLQERLGERLDLPAAGITEDVVDERLRPMGVDEETRLALHGLFHACNQARYAPARTGHELQELTRRVETALQAAQKIGGAL